MHHTDNGLGLIIRSELKESRCQGPFAHAAHIVDDTVDFADVPIALTRAAFGGACGPEPVEMGDVGKSGTHETQNLAVGLQPIARAVFAIVRTGQGEIAWVELIVKGVLAGFLKQSGDLERQVAQVLWGLFACFFHSHQVYRSPLMANAFSRSMACSAALSFASQRALP